MICLCPSLPSFDARLQAARRDTRMRSDLPRTKQGREAKVYAKVDAHSLRPTVGLTVTAFPDHGRRLRIVAFAVDDLSHASVLSCG